MDLITTQPSASYWAHSDILAIDTTDKDRRLDLITVKVPTCYEITFIEVFPISTQ